jgi:hypothetical protein
MDMDTQRQCVFARAIDVANSLHMFNANDFKEGASQ